MCSMDSISGECHLLRSGRGNLVSASRNAVRVWFGIWLTRITALCCDYTTLAEKYFRLSTAPFAATKNFE